ncbi:EAL domain-containing protein [Aromatoleum diolicum]|uniref:EAL domain-containing protein n=1 Tax=Aromatoleum diolicum TaxID=75796 RepID=A0ABX1QCA9_9RHOO|nr:EAL domain-containing protein [Aromatoleum diolicum]NMG74740.1 EAL domain-containing protein [Aromatoleum diolicum]
MSHPKYNKQIKGAWEKFLSGKDYSASAGLRPTIDESWRRCLVSRVDPTHNPTPPLLERSALQALRERHERLISASSPFMVQSRSLLARTGTVMILTDPEGTILDVEGDPRLRDAIERVHLVPGASWNETASGTNAIGTALVLLQPIQVHASEHFCEEVQKWSCSAAVIRDPVTAAILGVLDVSGLSGTYNKYSLPLVAMTAERIENQLAQQESERRLALLEACLPRLSSGDGVIVFDRHGNLVKANDKATAALAAWDVSLIATTRIPLPGAAETPDAAPETLPEWLLANRIEPILRKSQLLGFVVSIPMLAALSDRSLPRIGESAAARVPGTPSEPREALLSTMLDQSASVVFLKDMAGHYEFVNRCFEQTFGVRSADILGRTDAQIFNADLAQTLRRRELEAIAKAASCESVDELTLDGRSVWLAAVRFPIRDGSGEITSICTQANEIAQADEARSALRSTTAAVDPAGEGVLVTDANGHIVTVNAAFTRITGYAVDEVIGKPPRILKSGLHAKEFYQRMWRSLIDHGRWQGEIQNRRKNGDIYPEWLTIYSIKSADGAIQNFIAIFGDASAIKASQQHVEFMRIHDPLTGLPNRSLLMERLKECVDEAARLKDPLAVMLIGLDNFRDINDSLGHDLGDRLLQHITDRLRRCICDAHTIARLGGDEFAVVMRGATSEELHRFAANTLDYLSASFCLGGQERFITTSLGISLYPADGDSGAILLRNADTAMHAAKAGGRNRYQFFAEDMNARLRQRMSLETGLRAAIEHDRFRVVYQPQDDLVTGAMVGAEALLRWTDPTLGEVPASRFIPVAEEAGLIVTIGDIVLSKVLAQIALWRMQGLVPPRISINVAAQQMREPHFVEHLCELLERQGVPPEAICLELTEGTLMTDLDQTAQILSRITRHGIAISIDDFGTGYSSLSYLSRLPIQELKVDQSFVRTIADEAGNRSITTAIIDMAHALGMTVLAEGIETGAQLQILKDRHCEIGQGYYFHRPLSSAAFATLLAETSPAMH